MSDSFLKLETREDLQRLVDEGLEESLTLDYKDSRALTRNSDSINDLCKDVSALANSAGGQIVYGVEEDKKTRKPSRVDDGVEDPKITREWLEQILNSRVQPRMSGIQICRIDMKMGKFGYVITTQQSTTGPHQSTDQKYYKRFDLQSVPMYDYEIKDVMRRSTTPNIVVDFHFAEMERTHTFRYRDRQAHPDPVGITASIRNLADAPADYGVVVLFVDSRFQVLQDNKDVQFAGRVKTREGLTMNGFRTVFHAPKTLPIFKEQPIMLPPYGVVVPENLLYNTNPFAIGCEFRAPGCLRVGQGQLLIEGGSTMRLCFDPDAKVEPFVAL
jgi:hypothetical protein